MSATVIAAKEDGQEIRINNLYLLEGNVHSLCSLVINLDKYNFSLLFGKLVDEMCGVDYKQAIITFDKENGFKDKDILVVGFEFTTHDYKSEIVRCEVDNISIEYTGG